MIKKISKIILFVATILFLASCGGSEKYNQCKEIFRQQRAALKIDVWCECGQLESKYYIIGSQNGWNSTKDFLAVFMTELAQNAGCKTFAEWYDLNPEEEKKLDKEFENFKKLFDKRINKSCGDPVVKAYKKAYDCFHAAVDRCVDYKGYHIVTEVMKDTAQWGTFVDASAVYRINMAKVLTEKQLKEIKKIEENYNSQIAPLAHKYEEEYRMVKAEEDRLAAEKEAKRKAKAEADSLARVQAETRQRQLAESYKNKIPGNDYITDYSVRPQALSFINRYNSLTITIDLMGLYAMNMILAVEFGPDGICNVGCFYEADLSRCNDRGSALHHSMWQSELNKDQESLIENGINYSIKGDIIKIDGYGEWKILKDTKTLRNTSTGVELTRIDYKK